ncbi:dimethylamine corrinoid protein 3 [Selenomonas sp. WCA-380-WT-3B 3/]|uniref:Dimethylamine corrinoid protein 3 n=1 Tax=Selenomonas montiformis TaxID=2652285 RepID=A0A6I2USK5_9FIRM|nr:corrinoid protein [Selenomonas montiformis]MSV25168.1 dimethylamine corrinoid protein 3 [Selenomonas montiformis]
MSTKEEVLAKLKTCIEELDEDLGTEAAKEAVELGLDPIEAISKGLGAGMQTQSDLFDEGEVFVPQLVVAADIFENAVGIITADLSEEAKSATSMGKVLICTVESDIHDIGKNIVKTMLSASGFEVIDLGRDVSSAEVVAKAEELKVDIIAGAALMTTTMPAQRDIINLLKEDGVRDQYKCMFGGAPVSPEWVKSIGADAYAENAAEAIDQAKRLMAELRA